MLTPFFSIIIPLYNSGKTLRQALDSISSQSFKNYELVLVDGGSTDNTLQIINAFREINDINVKLVSEPDKGIYDAMNKGIKLASGEWLYFMGSDDALYSPLVLSQVFEAIEHEPVDLVYGNVLRTKSLTKYADDTVSKVLSRGIHHQGIFYKRRIFDFTGDYDPGFKVAADYHLTLKVFCNKAFKTKYINVDIAGFGEDGFSSSTYDYRFYSYHYKFLARQKAIYQIEDPLACIQDSIYCCLYLAKNKHDMVFAWSNALFYIFSSSALGFTERLRLFLRMLLWTIKY